VIHAYVGITDGDWYEQLAGTANLDEANFWQPGGGRQFGALVPGELFLFKLHSPRNYIVGGGLFSYSNLLPISLVWEAFGEKNGVRSFPEMRARVEKLRHRTSPKYEDFVIGNIILTQPFFFSREAWIPVPDDWKPNIVSGKRYDLGLEPGRSLWHSLQERLADTAIGQTQAERPARYGDPVLYAPRLGQGGFRVMVTDAYSKKCAITGEKTLPVLEAAHIRPYGEGGEHEINNGILFRSDIHTLFDRGYVTVDPGFRFEVSRRIREDFENGRDYYKLAGASLLLPGEPIKCPDPRLLSWHNKNRFLG
jgi:putative restriction endonuclease